MSRLIDADKLCEDLLNRWSIADTRKEELIRQVMADVVTPIVVGQPTIEPQKWISCDERLPGVETDILLQFSRNMCVGFLDQDNGWKIYSGGCWFTDILEGDLQPTAWMPLPEPYKEEQHD